MDDDSWLDEVLGECGVPDADKLTDQIVALFESLPADRKEQVVWQLGEMIEQEDLAQTFMGED